MFKSGFVSFIGRSNVGKSTLLNRILGEKLTIISDKPQTTRNKIQLIYTDENMQAIFLDTPGIQTPKNKLGDYMLKVSMSTLNEVDVITYIVDTTEEIGKLDSEIIKKCIYCHRHCQISFSCTGRTYSKNNIIFFNHFNIISLIYCFRL